MAWSLVVEQLPDLLTAFCDAEAVLTPAFWRAIQPFRFIPPQPEIDQFRPGKDTWRIGYWLYLPDGRHAPYEAFVCELDLGAWGDERLVQGWVNVRRYVGRGEDMDDGLWESEDRSVESPAAAAAAIRLVAAAMAEQLGRLDLRPYLAGKTAEPSAAPDRCRKAGPGG